MIGRVRHSGKLASEHTRRQAYWSSTMILHVPAELHNYATIKDLWSTMDIM